MTSTESHFQRVDSGEGDAQPDAFVPDPLEPASVIERDLLFPYYSSDIIEFIFEHWGKIRTRLRRQPHTSTYVFRLKTGLPSEVTKNLRVVFALQKTAFKLQLGMGILLKNIETGELRFFHSTSSVNTIFEKPVTIFSLADFEGCLNEVKENVFRQSFENSPRPNSKWRFIMFLCLDCYVLSLPFPME